MTTRGHDLRCLGNRTKKDAAQPNIELLEVHWLVQGLVGLGDHRLNNPLLEEADSEERKLVEIRNLVPKNS